MIVVFVFLGSLRATLIPAIAVPVSVMGSFAVLLAAGYSANTISLLAMVLAIGILVDDAIVVVENVERVMEEEPSLSPADSDGGDHCADYCDHLGALFGVRADCLHSWRFGNTVPAIRGHDQRRDADLGGECADVVACAVRCTSQPPRSKRGPMGWVLRRIDNIRDGYAAIVHRLVRVATLGVVTIMVSAAGIYLLSLRTPTGFLPEEDQGAFFISVQLPDGASVARTSEAARRIEVLLKQMPQVRNVFTVVGYSIVDGVSEPNMAFVVPTLKPFADRVGAANAAHAMIARVSPKGSRSAQRQSFPSTCRRSSDCRPRAGSNTTWKGSKDRSRRR